MELFESDGVALQERDFEILLGLFECRVMTLSHITGLYFGGKSEAAKKRIQKLKAGGYLWERTRRIGDPSVLHIGKKAYTALQTHGRLTAFPNIGLAAFDKRAQVSALTLRHELEVIEVRAAFFEAVRKQPQLSIVEFGTWPALHQFTAHHTSSQFGRRELTVKPDGFIRIREAATDGTFEHMFFLEVDRSTETQEIIAQKAACYLSYYQSGGLALRFGKEREDFKDFPFRVLMVFRNQERRNNAAERLLQNNPPILTQVWLATLPDVNIAPLEEIWLRPRDYLTVTEGTRFDPVRRPRNAPYFRESERERLIAAEASRHGLFG
jgi:hypothetical protein